MRLALRKASSWTALSGGVAHATLSVGSDALNVTAYESLVTLHPRHARHFLRTGDRDGPFAMKRGAMPAEELDEYKDLMIDSLDAVARDPDPKVHTARFPVSSCRRASSCRASRTTS